MNILAHDGSPIYMNPVYVVHVCAMGGEDRNVYIRTTCGDYIVPADINGGAKAVAAKLGIETN